MIHISQTSVKIQYIFSNGKLKNTVFAIKYFLLINHGVYVQVVSVRTQVPQPAWLTRVQVSPSDLRVSEIRKERKKNPF